MPHDFPCAEAFPMKASDYPGNRRRRPRGISGACTFPQMVSRKFRWRVMRPESGAGDMSGYSTGYKIPATSTRSSSGLLWNWLNLRQQSFPVLDHDDRWPVGRTHHRNHKTAAIDGHVKSGTE